MFLEDIATAEGFSRPILFLCTPPVDANPDLTCGAGASCLLCLDSKVLQSSNLSA